MNSFNIEYRRHKKSRTLKLRYDASNDIAIVTMPYRTSERAAKKFAEKHHSWLLAQRESAPTRLYLSPNEIIPFKGQNKKIIHIKDQAARVRVYEDEITVGGPLEGFSVRLENFLKKQARKSIEPLALEMAEAIQKNFKRIQIRDTKSRWGSCSSSGNLSFSWRLIMTPPDILRYVVAHEVSHLEEMNHSPAFWAVVDQLVDNAKISRKWLKNEGQSLMLVLRQ